MTSPQPAEPPDLAGLGARLTAKLIDLIITAAIVFIALMFLSFATLEIFVAKQYTDAEAYGYAVLFLGVPLYEAVMIATTAWRGKTLGKWFLGIQVVAYSDSLRPSALRSIIRWAYPLAPMIPIVDAFIRDIPELANDENLTALSGRIWWFWVAGGWLLLVHASPLWDRNRRGWHDKAADTIVIKAASPKLWNRGHRDAWSHLRL